MAELHIRQALLDDTGAISALLRSQVTTWQRLNSRGQVEDLPYEALTIYQRWLHGSHHDGAWMSLETGAIHLSHLLRGAGTALVGEAGDGRLVGYVEAYHAVEPEPFGAHLHLAHLVVQPGHEDVKAQFIAHLHDKIRVMMDCRRLTVSLAGYDADTISFYEAQGFVALARIRRFALPAKTGQSFYKAVEHLDPDAGQIRGWHMSVGRMESGRQHWEMLWPRLFDAIPQIVEQRTHRLHFSAAGQEAFVCCQRQLYNPRSADVYCWSPKPLTSQLLVAIRDWSHREGYRTLIMAVTEDTAKTLGPEAEPDPYDRQIYALDV